MLREDCSCSGSGEMNAQLHTATTFYEDNARHLTILVEWLPLASGLAMLADSLWFRGNLSGKFRKQYHRSAI